MTHWGAKPEPGPGPQYPDNVRTVFGGKVAVHFPTSPGNATSGAHGQGRMQIDRTGKIILALVILSFIAAGTFIACTPSQNWSTEERDAYTAALADGFADALETMDRDTLSPAGGISVTAPAQVGEFRLSEAARNELDSHASDTRALRRELTDAGVVYQDTAIEVTKVVVPRVDGGTARVFVDMDIIRQAEGYAPDAWVHEIEVFAVVTTESLVVVRLEVRDGPGSLPGTD